MLRHVASGGSGSDWPTAQLPTNLGISEAKVRVAFAQVMPRRWAG